MVKDTKVIVKFGDIPSISGLIESLTDVAAAGTKVVEEYESPENDYVARSPAINQLRTALITLNDYVDEHLDDE